LADPIAVPTEKYPPTYLVMGSEDGIFDISHMNDFRELLIKLGVDCKTSEVAGADHAFDIYSKVGDPVDIGTIIPAVQWVATAAGVKGAMTLSDVP
jgi:acetyl esterase/lipase